MVVFEMFLFFSSSQLFHVGREKYIIMKPDAPRVTEVKCKDTFLASLLVLQVGQFSKR